MTIENLYKNFKINSHDGIFIVQNGSFRSMNQQLFEAIKHEECTVENSGGKIFLSLTKPIYIS